MPEIKHNFTGGKMNKDLDERLVPNGQYRDAMNIQVTTSENSEVGTIQNILGNSLVPGQNFIRDGAFCVGSVTDEKNDKLYYFVVDQVELASTDNVTSLGSGATISSSNKVVFVAAPLTSYADPIVNDFQLTSGKTYTASATISEYDDALSSGNTIGFSSQGGLSSAVGESRLTGNGTISHQFVSNGGAVRIYAGGDIGGVFTNISVQQTTCLIVEYDSKTNSITPVLVDTIGDVLKFSRDQLITGINIVDNMLFWTDNYSEPKKINIPRSILGTDSSGLVHTEFHNEKTGVVLDIKEEHITILKKKPGHAPTIDLVSSRDSNLNYSGIMRITGKPTTAFTEQGGDASGIDYDGSAISGDGGNYQNESSFWINEIDWLNHYHDWSQFSVGSHFKTRIETDLQGNSGFNLEWQVGDILYFTPFGGENYDQAPGVPLSDFSVKAKIIQSSDNTFTDAPDELIANGTFETPTSNGQNASGWNFSSFANNSVNYNAGLSKYELDHPNDNSKMYYYIPGGWVENGQYKMEISISNYQNGALSINAVVPPSSLTDSSGNALYGNTRYFRPTNGTVSSNTHYAGNGVYTYEFTVSGSSQVISQAPTWGASLHDSFLIQFYHPTTGVSFIGDIDYVSVTRLDIDDAQVLCEVLNIKSVVPTVPSSLSEIKFAVDKFIDSEFIFKSSFPRIAYRYRYQDGEYSAISPFTQAAFLPGGFDYHPKKGYNIAMSNRVTAIQVSNYMSNTPDGVSEIDIIYKDDSSTNLYVVDTIKPNDSSSDYWNVDSYTIKSEQINRAIESNQLLRPWDNVPKKALAQEVSGSRIIYGNYIQGYDLKTEENEDYKPEFSVTNNRNSVGSKPKPSIKSLREYQIGAVFVDKYGRETPVVSNETGVHKITKENAAYNNSFEVSFLNTDYPKGLEYFKFFIKETSGEYYNMAMDRFYEAEDDQIWLSFPSSDINKIVIDDFLILKKALDGNIVQEEAKYKIIDIKEQAPEFIRTQKFLVDEIIHEATVTEKDLFYSGGSTTGTNDVPLKGNTEFKINFGPLAGGSAGKLENIGTSLYVEFFDTLTSVFSNSYQVASASTDFTTTATAATAKYTLKTNKKFGADIDFITDDPSGANPTKIRNNIAVRFYKYIPKNLSQFDGKFFVKIHKNSTAGTNIVAQANLPENISYRVAAQRKVYSIRDNFRSSHGMKWTGMVHGVYADLGTSSNTSHKNNSAYSSYGDVAVQGFGPYACYFRNYNKPSSHTSTERSGTADTSYTGQYEFGGHQKYSRADWVDELGWITGGKYFKRGSGSGNADPKSNFMGVGGNSEVNVFNSQALPGTGGQFGLKAADDQDITNSNRESEVGVWYINEGPTEGYDNSVNLNSNLKWGQVTKSYSSSTSGVETTGNRSVWKISLGGIHHIEPLVNPGSSTSSYYNDTIDNFWKIGETGGNPSYSSTSVSNFTERLSSGYSFRWKEDPSNNVYTVTHMDSQDGFINWSAGTSQGSGSSTSSPGNTFSAYSGSSATQNNSHVSAQLSPNFSRYWKFEAANEDDDGVVYWNPVGIGPISGGLELTTTAAAESTINSAATPELYVASLAATNSDGSTWNIEVGMILTSHSGQAATNDSYNGSNGQGELLIYKITSHLNAGVPGYKLYMTGYRRPLLNDVGAVNISGGIEHNIYTNPAASGQAMVFRQPKMNGYSQFSCNRINAQNNMNMPGTGVNDPISTISYNAAPRIMPVGYTLQVVEESTPENEMPSNPAIWETEPKEKTELDIYYEATGYTPIVINEENSNFAFPIGSLIEPYGNTNSESVQDNTKIIGVFRSGSYPDYFYIKLDKNILSGNISGENHIFADDLLKITRPDGVSVVTSIVGTGGNSNGTANSPTLTPAAENTHRGTKDYFYIRTNQYENSYVLPWHNCYSFGNGVESNRIKDTFNLPFISNGVKASTTVPFPSEGEEHRKYGLIYSGLYNSTSGVNNLNQFIAAEKITKDVNPIYGSIQKLHSRDTDLVTLCEDKVLKILANKDAVFNADGNPQLTANQNVLGQTMPFVGEYGISTNPESFASESYRAYFTDRVRGKVMRLSKDGLTPISEHGMSDWFKDNLSLGKTNLLGENNLASQDNWDIPSDGNSAVINGEAILGYYNGDPTDTDRFGKAANFKMNNVLEIGKTYRLRFDVIKHSGYEGGSVGSGYYKSITINNSLPSIWQGVGGMDDTQYDGNHVDVTWVANKTAFQLLQYQVCADVGGVRHYNGVPTSNFVNSEGGDWTSNSLFYGGTVRIKNLIVEEVKSEKLNLIGSYDDKKDEYNISIHGEQSNTVSFREDVKGWVSFKSFLPESGISCANDYYTLKEGKLWQHHNLGVNRNTFYNEFINSSFVAVLNDIPSSIKSYHTLEYEGSQSRVEGIKTVEVTGVQHAAGAGVDGKYAFFEVLEMSNMVNEGEPGWSSISFPIKQYRDNVLIREGLFIAWPNAGNSLTSPSGGPTKGHGRYNAGTQPGDFQVGDILSTKSQEDSVNHFNSTTANGWYVSSVETNKEKGSLPEFIEKEGKWFNYIKGVQSNIDETTDFGSFDVQGLGIVSEINGNYISIDGDLNASLQVGDTVYYEKPSQTLENNILDVNLFTSASTDLLGVSGENDGYTIVNNTTVTWFPTANTPNGVSYFNNIASGSDMEAGATYYVTLKVFNYDGTGSMGFSSSGGVPSSLRLSDDGQVNAYFVSMGYMPDLFARDTNSGTMEVSFQKVVPGGMLGFTQIESNQLQKAGVITVISDNVITVDNSGMLPLTGDYCLFVKNQIVNMNGLSGYYADVMFENNSKEKAELFAISSEITESSK